MSQSLSKYPNPATKRCRRCGTRSIGRLMNFSDSSRRPRRGGVSSYARMAIPTRTTRARSEPCAPRRVLTASPSARAAGAEGVHAARHDAARRRFHLGAVCRRIVFLSARGGAPRRRRKQARPAVPLHRAAGANQRACAMQRRRTGGAQPPDRLARRNHAQRNVAAGVHAAVASPLPRTRMDFAATASRRSILPVNYPE